MDKKTNELARRIAKTLHKQGRIETATIIRRFLRAIKLRSKRRIGENNPHG